MENYFYTVIEEWIDKDGNGGIQGFMYKDEAGQPSAVNRAVSHNHQILSSAAINEDLYHASCVVRSDGFMEKYWECYDRRPAETEG